VVVFEGLRPPLREEKTKKQLVKGLHKKTKQLLGFFMLKIKLQSKFFKSFRFLFAIQHAKNGDFRGFNFKNNEPGFITGFPVDFGFGGNVFAFGINERVYNDLIHCFIDSFGYFDGV
jgi:hypothetical protein